MASLVFIVSVRSVYIQYGFADTELPKTRRISEKRLPEEKNGKNSRISPVVPLLPGTIWE